MKLKEGRYHFTYNVGNGDIRTYDIFLDGQIKEKVARTGDVGFIPTQEALERLDRMIMLAEKEADKFKNVYLYDKTSKTKLDILLMIRQFLEENPILPSEVRMH